MNLQNRDCPFPLDGGSFIKTKEGYIMFLMIILKCL